MKRLRVLVLAALICACKGRAAPSGSDATTGPAPPADPSPARLAAPASAAARPRRVFDPRPVQVLGEPVSIARSATGRHLLRFLPVGEVVWAVEDGGEKHASEIVRLGIADGSRASVAREVFYPDLVWADAASVVYAALCTEGLASPCIQRARAGPDAGAPRRLAVAREAETGAAVQVYGDAVYFLDHVGTTTAVRRVPLTGGVPVTVASAGAAGADAGPAVGGRLLVDAASVYWSEPYTILRAPRAERGAIERMVTGSLDAADGTYLYWGSCRHDHAVRRAPLAGGPAEALVAHPVVCALGVTTHDGFVYWLNGSEGHPGSSLLRVPSGGGDVEHLGIRKAVQYAFDGGYLYWLDDAGELRRAPLR
jgi:hypothetical protein